MGADRGARPVARARDPREKEGGARAGQRRRRWRGGVVKRRRRARPPQCLLRARAQRARVSREDGGEPRPRAAAQRRKRQRALARLCGGAQRRLLRLRRQRGRAVAGWGRGRDVERRVAERRVLSTRARSVFAAASASPAATAPAASSSSLSASSSASSAASAGLRRVARRKERGCGKDRGEAIFKRGRGAREAAAPEGERRELPPPLSPLDQGRSQARGSVVEQQRGDQKIGRVSSDNGESALRGK